MDERDPMAERAAEREERFDALFDELMGAGKLHLSGVELSEADELLELAELAALAEEDPALALELEMAQLFAEEEAETPLGEGAEDQAVAARVLAALDETYFSAEAEEAEQESLVLRPNSAPMASGTKPARRVLPKRVYWLMVGAFMLVASTGAASFMLRGVAPWSTEPVEAPETPEPRRSRRMRARPVEPAPEPVVLPEVVEEAVPAEEPTAERRRPRLSAAELFSRASQARRRGERANAIALYRRLQRQHRGSPQALASRVSLGRLYLRRPSDPRAALRLFDRYLASAPGGTLAPEARYNRAVALRRLGRGAAERRALQLVLRRDPHSSYASAASRRLEELQ